MFEHNIGPFFDEKSNILILGSFPSVKSREENFYYANKQNRFWKDFLTAHRIALWDVIASCEILGSSDASIKNVTPSDISLILENSPIEKLVLNGKKATQLFYRNQGSALPLRNCRAQVIEVYELPSTSPANTSFSIDKLIAHWSIISK